MISCSGVEFLGAKKYNYLKGFYVERWFLNPDYKTDIPKDTAFYGAAANKIKDKFIIKYYIADKDDSIVEIPKKDMWKIKSNSYIHIKISDNLYKVSKYAPSGLYNLELIPIKKCYKNGWCKLYPTSYDINAYIEKSNIYQ